MIVDVDIRISNDEGIPVQNFTKRFDGRFEGNKIYDVESKSGKSFEEFLAEYLSYSGRAYRTSLLSDVSGIRMIKPVEKADEDFAENQLEYYIKIGNGQSIAGTIPLNRLAYLSTIGESVIEDVKENTRNVIEGKFNELEGINKNNKYAVRLVSALLENAIEKYEASFYHVQNDLSEEFVG